MKLPTFLPGTLTLDRGNFQDYRALCAFHYLASKPATVAAIFTIRYRPRRAANDSGRAVAVGVLSWPVPSCRAREETLGRRRFTRTENLHFANRRIRTISRVIVHPQFRSLGLSTLLVRCLCENCKTRYVEAIAAMGKAVPLFRNAGMREVIPRQRDRPMYYVLDRWKRRRPHRPRRSR